MSILVRILPGAEWLPLLAEIAAKATLILLLTALVAALLWRASAAVRHLVWCVGVAGVLVLPLLSAFVPAWELPLLPASSAAAPPALLRAPENAATAAALPSPVLAQPEAVAPAVADGAWLTQVAAWVIAGGVLLGLVWLAAGFWGVARLGRSAEVVRDPEWLRMAQEASERLGLRRPVLLLRSRGAVMPATWGLLWPSVVLPSTADMWPADRRRAVLAHELAHVKRFDCLTQTLAQVACALLWWHPAVWYAARRLRVERERACDDLVLGAGARASDYATHLLEIARSHRGARLEALAMVSMAKPSQLESRLLWVLDDARERGAPSVRAALLAVAAGLLVVGPLAAVRPTEAAPPVAAVLQGAPAAPATPETTPAAPETPAEEPEPAEPPAEPVPARSEAAPPEPAAPEVPAKPDTVPGKHTLDELISMRAVGVDAAYIESLRQVGYTGLSSQELVSLRAVGVTARYAATMNALGFGRLAAHQLVSLRAVGVTPEYLEELRAHGHTGLSLSEIQGMRAVGVTGAYITEMNRAGYGRIPAGQIVSLKALGVTPAYLRELEQHGLRDLSLEQVKGMRAVGVTGAYVAEMEALGFRDLDVGRLTQLYALGITPAYVRELGAAGFGPLTPDQLVRLRASGVDRELMERRRGKPSSEKP